MINKCRYSFWQLPMECWRSPSSTGSTRQSGSLRLTRACAANLVSLGVPAPSVYFIDKSSRMRTRLLRHEHSPSQCTYSSAVNVFPASVVTTWTRGVKDTDIHDPNRDKLGLFSCHYVVTFFISILHLTFEYSVHKRDAVFIAYVFPILNSQSFKISTDSACLYLMA